MDLRCWRYWYDREIRSWTVQELDEAGYQLQPECDYFPRKQELIDSHPAFSFTHEPDDLIPHISMNVLRHYIREGMRWKVMGMALKHSSLLIREHLPDQEWDEYHFLLDTARESL